MADHSAGRANFAARVVCHQFPGKFRGPQQHAARACQREGRQSNKIPESTFPFRRLSATGRIGLSRERRRPKLRPPAPVAHVAHGLSCENQILSQVRSRTILQRRSLLLLLRNSGQIVKPMNIAAANSNNSRGNSRRTQTKVCSRCRGNQTQLTQLALAYFGLAPRLRPFTACPQFRRRGEKFQVLRKDHLVQRHREITPRRQFHAHVHRGLPADMQVAEYRPRKTPHLQQDTASATSRKIINMRGDGSDSSLPPPPAPIS